MDGAVRILQEKTAMRIVAAYLTKKGGETVSLPQ
jgi:hypothetical protein